jgi:hypothetical protein
MPQIPRGADISRRVPDGQQVVSRRDTSAAGAGAAAISSSLVNIAGDRQEVADTRSRYQLSQAKNAFLGAKTRQDHAYDNDQDYDTIATRYENEMRKEMESASQLIDDPRTRALFLDDAGLQYTQGSERIKTLANGVERDYQRADTNDALRTSVEAIVSGDIRGGVDAMEERIDAAVGMDYYSKEEGDALLVRTRDTAVAAYIDTLEPEEAVAEMERIGEMLPLSVQSTLNKRIKAELNNDVAVANVDSYTERTEEYPEGMDYGQAMEASKSITDTKVRLLTEQRIGTVYQQKDNAKNDWVADTTNELWDRITQGEMVPTLDDKGRQTYMEGLDGGGEPAMHEFTWDDISASVKERLPPGAEMDLMRAGVNRLSRKDPVTPVGLMDELYKRYNGGKGSPSATRKYFTDNRSAMSYADQLVWSKITAESFAGMEADAVFQGAQGIRLQLMAIPGISELDEDAISHLQGRYAMEHQDWVYKFRAEPGNDGRDPSGEQSTQQIERMMLRVPTVGRGRMGGIQSEENYEFWDDLNLEKGERNDAIDRLKQINPERYELVRQMLVSEENPIPEYEDIAFLFMNLGEGNIGRSMDNNVRRNLEQLYGIGAFARADGTEGLGERDPAMQAEIDAKAELEALGDGGPTDIESRN